MRPPPLRWLGNRRALRAGLLSILLSPTILLLATAADPPANWDPIAKESTGGFIMSLARDAEANLWIGTEDKGIIHIPAVENPLLPGGQQFTRKDAAPDNGYALCFDGQHRLWAGSLRNGVSVHNGDKWRSYDVLDGPIGERIFAIATCPTDGDIWIATSAGLTHYSQKNDSWSYHTRAEGLPEDQANAIAFNSKGDIFVGTQCHGIAMAKATDDYKKWTVATGPITLPTTPTGRGLPTPLINGMCVSKTGTVYAATSAGLAWSNDAGKTWAYIRGKDYADKAKGRWGGAPRGWRPAAKQVMDTLLPEDYVTCVCESSDGLIWLGFRQQGYVAIDPKTFRVIFSGTKKSEALPDDYVTCILPMPDYRPYVGTYGGGVARAKKPMKAAGAKTEAKAAMKVEEKPAALPSPAQPPTVAEMNALAAKLAKVPAAAPKSAMVVALNDDWRTQGTWIDRYGRYCGVLCAMAGGGNNYICGYHGSEFTHHGWLGRHCQKGDGLRHWVHWIKTDNPRSLQNPSDGGRKQSEWDDHGEEYPMTWAGPHVYGSLHLPPGEYCVSLYFFNKDGHEGMNRCRDYLAELKPLRIEEPLYSDLGWPGKDKDAERLYENDKRVAAGRVMHFWGGVYKRFYINMPPTGKTLPTGGFTVRVNRNYSFNTILSAIFVDKLGKYKDDWGEPRPQWVVQEFAKRNRLPPEAAPALELLKQLLALRERNPLWYARNARPYQLALARRLLARRYWESNLGYEISSSGRHPDFKEDAAKCFNDLQIFYWRDRVFFAPTNQLSAAWKRRTEIGFLETEQKWTSFDRKKYRLRFIEEMRLSGGWMKDEDSQLEKYTTGVIP